MVDDIRILLSMRNSRKKTKLATKLKISSIEATGLLVTFWLSVAEDCPNGDISKWDNEDIAISCEWSEDADILVKALKDCGWIGEDENGKTIVPKWSLHQPWAMSSELRTDQARLGALVIRRKKLGAIIKKQGYKLITKHDYNILMSRDPKMFYKVKGYDKETIVQLVASYQPAPSQPIADSDPAIEPAPAPIPSPAPQSIGEDKEGGLSADAEPTVKYKNGKVWL